MHRLFAPFFALAVILVVVACADSTAPPTVTVSATATPTSTATPASTATATLTPKVAVTSTPAGRPPAVTRLIEAVSARDTVALGSMLQFVRTPCTTAQGAGGPPKCGPVLSAGTVVEVLPVSSCELGWYEPEQARDLAASTLPSVGELQAVLRVTQPLFVDTGAAYPALTHAAVFTRRASGSPERAVVYGLNTNGVAYIELTCDSTAQQLLESPRYRGAEVLR